VATADTNKTPATRHFTNVADLEEDDDDDELASLDGDVVEVMMICVGVDRMIG
jgi:hypothetical protein